MILGLLSGKQKFSEIRSKIMIRRTKNLISDQLPKKGKVNFYSGILEQYFPIVWRVIYTPLFGVNEIIHRKCWVT